MAAKKQIFASRKRSRDQNLKTTFPKECFNEIGLKLGVCEYNYIAGIKFCKFYSWATLGAINFFRTPKMQFYAN